MDFLQKLEQKNLEIDQKKQIIAKLARQNARLKDEILMSQEKIGQIDERIENHNHELTYRRQRLKELAAENPKLEEQAVKQVKAEEGINYKNIEKDIRQKVYNIISQREGAEVDPTELFFFEGQKLEVKPNTIINTVKVKYISLMLPSEEERGMKTVPKEATFRISKSTTLNQLRTQACDYWVNCYLES